LAWDYEAKRYGSGYEYATMRLFSGTIRAFDQPYTPENVYGSYWEVDIGGVVGQYDTDYFQGYGREKIRISKSKFGHTLPFVGFYAHPWYTTNASISIGPVSVGFGSWTGDKWKWTDSITIGY
jgi:hypothetical protein